MLALFGNEGLAWGYRATVGRSTTGANWMDRVETGWTEPHVGDPSDLNGRKPSPCQGEGRGFESRLPLQRSS